MIMISLKKKKINEPNDNKIYPLMTNHIDRGYQRPHSIFCVISCVHDINVGYTIFAIIASIF